MKNVLLHCRSGKLGSFLAIFLADLWFWVIPSVSSTWMHDWFAVVSVLAAWGRMILVFYQEIYISQVAYSIQLLPDCKYSSFPCAPQQTWLTVSAVFWDRLTCFIFPHVVSFLHCLFGAHRATELELDEKISFWKGKKLLPVQFCSFKEGGDCICGVTCLLSKLQGIPGARAMEFSMHFLYMNAEYSHRNP